MNITTAELTAELKEQGHSTGFSSHRDEPSLLLGS